MAMNEGQLAYLNSLQNFTSDSESQKDTNEEIPFYKSVLNSIGRGIMEGGISVNKLFGGGGIASFSPSFQQEEEERKEQRKQILPTDESIVPRTIERGIKTGLESMAFPLGAPFNIGARGVIGGSSAELSKEAGAPEWLQTLIEIAPQFAPSLSKTIPSRNPKQEELLKFGRSKGLSEEQLALTLEKEGKFSKGIKKVAHKGEALQSQIKETRESIGNVYESLRDLPKAKAPLTHNDMIGFLGEMKDKLVKMPSSMRDKIKVDMADFLKSKHTGVDVFDLWHKINYHIKKGEPQLGVLKETFSKALKTLDPSLEHEFKLANQLYANLSKNAKDLKPSIVDKILNLGKYGQVIYGLLSGNTIPLKAAVGIEASRRFSEQLVKNPRLQNLSTRFSKAIKSGAYPIIHKVGSLLMDEIKNSDPELYEELSQEDIEKVYRELSNPKK